MRLLPMRPLASLIVACSLTPLACGGDVDTDQFSPDSGGQGGEAGASGGGGTGGAETGGTGGAETGGTGGAETGGAGGAETGGAAGEAGQGGTGGAAGACTPGSTLSCYSGPAGTVGVGICKAGTQTCNAQGTGYDGCQGEVTPTVEDCATPADENCDAQTPSCSQPIVDLRADVNRNGTIDLADPTEDANEHTWDSTHGALFLANIDDDDDSCADSGTDAQLASCHDASNTTIDGNDDLADLARLKTVPWPGAPDNAVGTLEVSSPAANYVRLFKNTGGVFQVFNPASATLSATELRSGVEFALEGKDVLRDAAAWDGYVNITLSVAGGGTDVVRMRMAPMLLRHHVDNADTVYATSINDQDSVDFRNDLSAAVTASGTANPLAPLNINDQWTQDLFETAYMSMPAVGGQKIIHVNIRSANFSQGKLRSGGRVLYTTLRGKDTGAVTQYDPNHPNTMDSLNSFGNTETIPPYSFGGQTYPEGRILRGATASYYPDESVDTMFQAQGAQPTVFLDTEWLLVGHVDETVSFFKASNARGWAMMINDPGLARQMLQSYEDDGYGATKMFAGMQNYYGKSAAVSISKTLDDTDLMNTNAWAAVEVTAQLNYLKQVTGITDAEIVKIPFLWTEAYGRAVAHIPGMINGIMLSNNHFGPPDPHGPVVQGEDIFKAYVENALAPWNVTVHWIEDWYLYHILDGEVHCGSNTKRVIPATHRWWEGG